MNENELLATMKARHANLTAELRRLEKAMAVFEPTTPAAAPSGKKRGRPPGSKNKGVSGIGITLPKGHAADEPSL